MQKIWAIFVPLNLIIGMLIYWILGMPSAGAFWVGGAMLGAATLLYSWAWGLVGLGAVKKLIAFAVPLIVMKYVLFGVIIYWVTHVQKWNLVYFCLGVGSFVVAVVLRSFSVEESI